MATFINEEKNFIFIHTPKTGGMSVTKFFLKSNRDPYKLELSKHNDKLGIHSGARAVYDILGDDYWNYHSFAFYRNTWDWIFSLYKYILKTPSHPKYNDVHGKTFEEFIFKISPSFYRPQWELVADKKGRSLVSSLYNYDDFSLAFEKQLSFFGYENANIGHYNKNKSLSANYREMYSEKMKIEVLRQYEADINYFNFKF